MASQVDDPVASHEPLIPSLHTEAEKYCITCGKSDRIDLCSGCKSVWYCNKTCQKTDWPCHKLLCSNFAKSNAVEPLDGAYRAFLFRTDSLRPEVVILPTSWHRTFDMDPVRELFRKPGDRKFDPSVHRCHFGFSCRLNDRHLRTDCLQVIFRDTFRIDGSKANKSILASVRATGIACPHLCWAGNIIVRRIKPMGRPKTATMADFRHALDWLATYPQHLFYEGIQAPATPLASQKFWRFDDVKGVMIAGDHQIKDESKRYIVVNVPDDHRIRGLNAKLHGDISPVSKLVGRPVRLIVNQTLVNDVDVNGKVPMCTPSLALMRSLEKDMNSRMPHVSFCLPKGRSERPKGILTYDDWALVISADDRDLSVNDVKAMVHFSQNMCRGILPCISLDPRDTASLEAAMQRALDFMTWENYLRAYDELGMPRPQRPSEEAFVDMRDTTTPDPPADEDDEKLADEYEL